MTGERIKEIRQHYGMKQGDFAAALGIKASAISQMESNRIKPSLDTMLLINQKFGVNLNWLLSGRGDMLNSGAKDIRNKKLEDLQQFLSAQLQEISRVKDESLLEEVLHIPVSGEIAAGIPMESIDQELDVICMKSSMIRGKVEDYISLRVNGRSMEPDIRHNDVILIRKDQDWYKLAGQICAVRIDGAITLKKMVLDTQKQVIILVALNEEFKPIVVNPEEHRDIVLIGQLYFLYRKI